jgi:D-inositol-3-phosphate glycosyltransferase
MKLDDSLLTARLAPARRIALISDHASPLAAPGSIDCGGQNVYVAHLARPASSRWCNGARTSA